MSTSLQVRIQTVQTGIQTGIQTVVKYIQTIQTVKDNGILLKKIHFSAYSPVCMVCMYFTTVCMPVCIPVCTVCMARNYTKLNLCIWTPTAGVDALGRFVFPRRLCDEI